MTERQSRFVEEYLIDLNATQAAIRAGYSEKSAYSQGERLLKNAEVRKAITAAAASRSERTQVDADYVLTKLKFLTEHCTTPGQVDPRGAVGALNLIGKHLKMFVERVELGADESLAALLAKAARGSGSA